MTADDIIKAVRDLPSLPAVVSELLASIDQEDLDTHALASKITLDQALTAKTLRLANSSFYGMPSKVNTIHQAVAVLGFHSIRTLVTACAVTSSFPAAPASGLDFPAFWRHAVASAVCARVLAPYCRISPDTAFTAGLLHDLGTLVLATRFPTQYRLVIEHQRQHDCLSVTSQRAVFGVTADELQHALIHAWKLPGLLIELLDDTRGAHPRVRTIALATTFTRHVARGWDDPALPDDLAALAALLPLKREQLLERLGAPVEAWSRLLPEAAR